MVELCAPVLKYFYSVQRLMLNMRKYSISSQTEIAASSIPLRHANVFKLMFCNIWGQRTYSLIGPNDCTKHDDLRSDRLFHWIKIVLFVPRFRIARGWLKVTKHNRRRNAKVFNFLSRSEWKIWPKRILYHCQCKPNRVEILIMIERVEPVFLPHESRECAKKEEKWRVYEYGEISALQCFNRYTGKAETKR